MIFPRSQRYLWATPRGVIRVWRTLFPLFQRTVWECQAKWNDELHLTSMNCPAFRQASLDSLKHLLFLWELAELIVNSIYALSLLLPYFSLKPWTNNRGTIYKLLTTLRESHFWILKATPSKDEERLKSHCRIGLDFYRANGALLGRTTRTSVRPHTHCPALSNIGTFGAVLESNRDGSLSRWPTGRSALVRSY